MKIDRVKVVAIVGGVAIIVGAEYFMYKAYTSDKSLRHKIDILEVMSQYPVEYWEARRAATKASIEKHRISTESNERLIIDKRNRNDKALRERLEFEKTAPDGYWEYKRHAEEEETKRKKHSEEEETKRRQIISDETRFRRLDDRERYITDRNARTMENIANNVRMSVTGSLF